MILTRTQFIFSTFYLHFRLLFMINIFFTDSFHLVMHCISVTHLPWPRHSKCEKVKQSIVSTSLFHTSHVNYMYFILPFDLLSCRISSAPLSKLRLDSPCKALKRYSILWPLVCDLFPVVHSMFWCSVVLCWSNMYVSVKLQFNQTRSGFSSIEIKCKRTRRNGLHQGAHVCSIRASVSPCVGHISSLDSPKAMSVGLFLQTVFGNIYCSSLFFLLYLLSRDTSATASVLKNSPRSKSAFSKPKGKRYMYTRTFRPFFE